MSTRTFENTFGLASRLCQRIGNLPSTLRQCSVVGTFAIAALLPTLLPFVAPPASAAPAPRFDDLSGAMETAITINDARPTADLVRLENRELGHARLTTLAQANPENERYAQLASRGGWRVDFSTTAARPQVGPQDFPRLKGQQLEFMLAAVRAAQESQARTGVPASVIIAQALLESDWGRSNLAKSHNYFGIKAHGGPGTAGVVNIYTKEYQGGWITVAAPFRAYHTMADGFADHGKFLSDNPRYAEAMRNKHDPKAFVRAVHRAGYATDPAYSDKLIRVMDSHNLYRFDAK